MRRFFLPEVEFVPGKTYRLPTELSHHIGRVLRLSVGDEMILLNGRGRVARARLEAQQSVLVLKTGQEEAPPLQVELIQGLPRGEKLDLVLQKGTELGVNRFSVVAMERSVGRVRAEKRDKRLQRWRKIVQEAARQSRQPYLPDVQIGDSYAGVLAASTAKLKLLLWEDAEQSLSETLPAVAPDSVALLVGPEGGISPAEASLAENYGYSPVRLGQRILRTETAGLAIMAVLQYLYGDLAHKPSGICAVTQGKDES